MNSLLKKVERVFLELGFQYKTIGNKQIRYLCKDNCYCKITYIDKFKAFVIESADGIEDAVNGILEDGDLYYMDTPEAELLWQIREDVRRYYM